MAPDLKKLFREAFDLRESDRATLAGLQNVGGAKSNRPEVRWKLHRRG
jgi:hypothetical protein